VDGNELQAMDQVSDVGLDNAKLAEVLSTYTKYFAKIDGHDETSLKNSYDAFFKQQNDNFSILFCDTLKGKGVKVCENSIAHHFRCPTEDGYELKGES
jgi:transketolase